MESQTDRPRFKTHWLFDIIFLVAVGVALADAYVHRVAVADWLFFLTYKPSPQMVELANKVGFTDEGRRLFYRGNPQITSDQAAAQAACGGDDSGCLTTHGDIIIYSPTGNIDSEIVTAAHETLHLAYRRYDQSTRSDVDDQVEAALGELKFNSTLQSELQGYQGDELLDEAHSYIGTEQPTIPHDLESHYREYFQNRAQIVAANANSSSSPR